MVGADVLDDGQPEAGAAGGARAGGVDAVEPLEDASLLGLGDALALVADVDLDQAVLAPDADGDLGAVAGVVDGVADQVADRGGEQLGVAEDLGVAGQRDGQLDRARLGDEPALVDRIGRGARDVDEHRLVQGVGDLQPRQVDDLLHQLGQALALDLHPPGEPGHGLGVVVGVEHGLGQQRHPAHRRLQLVADVGDEVAAHLLDPAGVGAVVDQEQHVRAAEGRDPCGDRDPAPAERAAGQVELGLADHPVTPYLPGQVTQLGVGQLGVAHQAVDDRGRAGLDHLRRRESTTMPLERRTASTSPTPGGRAGGSDSGIERWERSERRTRPTETAPMSMPITPPRVAAAVASTALSVRSAARVPRTPRPPSRTSIPTVHLGVQDRSRPGGSLVGPRERRGRDQTETREPCATPSTRTSTRSPTSWSR